MEVSVHYKKETLVIDLIRLTEGLYLGGESEGIEFIFYSS